MKKKLFGRILAWALTLAVLMTSGALATVNTAFAATDLSRIYVTGFNTSIKIREGEKLTSSLFKKLKVQVKGQIQTGKSVTVKNVKCKELNEYIHSKNGKFTLHLASGKATTSISVPVKVQAKKLTVKVKGTLPEGQILTDVMLLKALKASVTYKDGKKVSNFKGYTCKKIGSVVKSSNGKIKLPVAVGNVKKTVTVKVNKIQRIFIGNCKLLATGITEGTSVEEIEKSFRKGTSVYANYAKGANKKLTTYSVKMVVSKDAVVVTVKYGKFSDKISIPVIATPAPTTQPSAEPSVEPSQVPTDVPASEQPSTEPSQAPTAIPTATASASAKPSVTPSVSPSVSPSAKPTETPKPTITPGGNGGGNGGFAPKPPVSTPKPTTKPSASPSVSPSVSPSATPSTAPTPAPNKKFTLEVNKRGEGTVNMNDKALAFVDDTVNLTDLDAGRCKFEAVPADGYKFDGWYDEETKKTIGTNATLTLNIASNREISAIFAEIDGTVNVTYQHEDGTVLVSQSVSFGGTINPPTSNVYRIDKDFDGWMFDGTLYRGEIGANEFYSDAGVKLSDAIKASTILHKDVTIFTSYTDKPVKYYNVSITNGTLTQPAEYAGQSTATVPAGTHIFAETEVPEGQNAVWQNASGVTVGNGKRYDCTVNSDVDVTAVFTTEEAEPTCYFNAQPTVDTVNCRYSYNISCRIPATYQKTEWGVVVSPLRSSADELVLGGANVMSLPDDVAETKDSLNADLRYTWTAPPRIIESYNVMYFRVYVVTDKGTIYSDIQSVVW